MSRHADAIERLLAPGGVIGLSLADRAALGAARAALGREGMTPVYLANRQARDAFWRGLVVGLSLSVAILLSVAAVLL